MTGAVGALVLLLSIGLQFARRLGTAASLCAVQALLAAMLLAEAGAAAAALALVLNGLVMPAAMTRLAGAGSLLTPRIGAHACWSAVSGILVATVALFAGLGADGRATVGAAVALLGLVLVTARSHALAPALGLLSSQSGLMLVASASPTPSFQATLLVAVPLVPALATAGFWLRQ